MIHVEGSGFGKEEIVRVDLGKHLGIGRARTDESGNFTTEFKLKEEKVGEVRVVAIGLKSYNVGTAIFNVIEEKKKDKEEEIQSQEK
jgi:predicted transcriptional regulator